MMTALSLKAADLHAEDGIRAEVVHLASIKPIDADLIERSVERTGFAVASENASIDGGLGAAVAECSENAVPCHYSGSAISA